MKLSKLHAWAGKWKVGVWHVWSPAFRLYSVLWLGSVITCIVLGAWALLAILILVFIPNPPSSYRNRFGD